jgi:hypothetical protein
MYNLVCGRRYAKQISYRKLLTYLHDTEFIFTISKDENRAQDGIDLRYRFVLLNETEDLLKYLGGPCSVLEMMIALAIRIEEDTMDDPAYGDRTGQWFWGMITTLGIGAMTDDRFDKEYVSEVITRFLNRDYDPDGKGGLFRLRHCNRDLRDVEIWHQMCWYIDEIS